MIKFWLERSEFMKPMIEIFIVVILLASVRAYDINDSLEYGIGHNAFSLNSINSSNSSLSHEIYNMNRSGLLLFNKSFNINYSNWHGVGQENIALNLKNRSNLSIISGTIKFNISDDQLYNPINFVLKPEDMRSNFRGDNSTEDFSQNPAIIVHVGQSIQAAIDAAASGDTIEVNSGTYNENLRIDKRLTIRGVDVGGDLPIIDANGIGNSIEISADQVILENIVCTNSSRSGMRPGAGVRFSSSNNCSMERIELYNNYYGINLADSTNNTISECNISDNQYGVRIYFSNSNRLQNSEIKENLNPLNIVSSEGNIISDNTFADNSHEVETSKDNKIIDNDENFMKDLNQSREIVELNAKPRPQPIQSSGGRASKSSHSSEKDGDGIEWGQPVMPNDKGKDYQNFAQKAAGTLVFNPPQVMTSGAGEWIDARIGLENTTQLVQGLLGKGEVQFRDVSTETNMTYVVKLESDSGFEIQAKRPDAQILGIDPAVWLWLVTPLKEGNHTLILSVDLQLEKPPFNCRCINVTYWPVSVRVLEPDPQQRVMNFVSSSYSLTTGAIAFLASLFSLIVLYRQFKKRN